MYNISVVRKYNNGKNVTVFFKRISIFGVEWTTTASDATMFNTKKEALKIAKMLNEKVEINLTE